ncbi:hypothetical protein SAMN04515674_11779 [Pseudarcicella hirudinis]|uniref:Uncharacterized protein n=2 Tax=Pseudarcicella hirudinis TaxID=1079859 RepID=A0A1I5Y7R8_9BACT|nr:glycoside hydrolase family 127 protein [Pseudarcicella hirudinis]SFQ40265.1 hypothetical protein SAMN04515674_11779 [Pseudarcicella hirudinis]
MRNSRILFICLIFLYRQLCQAQSHYPGQHQGKFALNDKFTPAVYAFDLHNVRLLDGRFKDNMLREQAWLRRLNTRQLLHSFRNNAGIFDANEGGYFLIKKYGGWESLDCDLRGHTTGHLLSGLALMYAQTGDEYYKLKSDSLVKGLAEVQAVLNQEGYLSAFPQELINRNIAGKSVWAPWYTLHKIFSGLIDQYLYCDNQQALNVAEKMGMWAYKKLQNVDSNQRSIMLRNEFGGINESFYNLYAITGKKEYQWLGQFFYHNEIIDLLKQRKDILAPKHANTFIPKLLGLTRNYELDGLGDSDTIAKFFWDTVIEHHTFATGSNSDKEHFFKPDELSKHLTGYTGETCNVYNMLKLTKHLFTHTREMKYIEYYEKALFNHILGQQDPATGMVSYFLPMLAGAHKVYSTPENSFWCCVGSGFENHAKYGESIYYHDDNGVFINLFIASQLNWKEKGLTLQQETSFPASGQTRFIITTAPTQPLALHFRFPSWAKSMSVLLNGKPQKIKTSAGSYSTLSRIWKPNDIVEISFPMELQLKATNDNSSKVSITYGPIVLAGKQGSVQMESPAPYSDPNKYNDYYTYQYNVPANIVTKLDINNQNIAESIEAMADQPLTFKAKKEGIILQPLYNIHHERYVVYWDLK